MSDNITGQGLLYLCATPIGNLEDITFRVIRTLKEVDLIAAEDTRNSIKLLNHFEIKTPMKSYHEHNKVEKARVLVDKMRAGTNIALITDAGTPGISDPGEELVRQCHEAGIQVTSLPGAAACITALTMSGQPTRRFVFEAFLPFDKKERADVLEELKNETRTIIIHEAPHHLAGLIDELTGVLGGDRSVSICKELTKRYEKVWKTTLEEAAQFYKSQQPRGEYVLVIAGRDRQELKLEKQKSWDAMSIQEHVAMYENQGIDRKEAMRMAAKDRGISKRDVYQQLLS
ncbi:MAG: 16S rRNA (cytidine(1402)-2'-O)-methyltransferase [Clostridia bacterium]|nr:16S rRNA (cytidine(1402)-2'-O)-methyltransferase [Clostridia bacterium]